MLDRALVEKLSNHLDKLEKMTSDINRLVASTDRADLQTIINHRRACAVLFGDIDQAVNSLPKGENPKHVNVVRDFAARFAKLRSRHLELQANWPASSMSGDRDAYQRAKAHLDSEQSEFMRWSRAVFLQVLE